MTRLEEYEYLLERSRRFLATAELQIDKGFYDLALFSLEQALQLYLKAVVLRLGVDYPRTHSVRKLLELVYKLTGSDEVEKFFSNYAIELGVLEDAFITSRYIPREYTKEEAKRLLGVVREVIEVVNRSISRGSH
ncbi:MAG: HEPN domain-containing protein [Thermogladius sp.]|nr:HEPN domain-containing protein [Thermogladius sp.]